VKDSSYTSFWSLQGVRQHALSIITDAFLDKHGSLLPAATVCKVLPTICIPLAGKRITILLSDENRMNSHMQEIMIEFEQCTSLMFKPLLHHLKSILKSQADFLSVWTAILEAMERLLSEAVPENNDSDEREMSSEKLIQTLKELASEHLRNSIMVMHSHGVLTGRPRPDDEVSTSTWDAVGKMAFCSSMIEEWKLQASAPPAIASSPSSD
jgi:hypothetical protein